MVTKSSPINCHVRHHGPNYFCILNFLENVLTQIAKASKLVGPPHRILKFRKGKQHVLEATSDHLEITAL